jgi:hypothetical protein
VSVLNVTNLESTSLYSRLKQLSADGDNPALAGNVRDLCREGADRLKIFPAAHRQFTLHDEVHSLRVVVLMAGVLGAVLDKLNDIEIALLILAAFFHDQGMIAEAEELGLLRESEAWELHEAQWHSDHPNFGELLDRLADPLLGKEQRLRAQHAVSELDAAMFTDFIRQQHGERSASFVYNRYGNDPRLQVSGRHIGGLLATVCKSHVLPAASLTEISGYSLGELVGTTRVNVALLAFVLRLADILDFDRDRTPDALYRAIDFTSGVSLQEWDKHRSIVGWEVSPTRISFAAECEHPAYERAIRQFLNWIDRELTAAREWAHGLPREHERYQLLLPAAVDAHRVGPRVDPVSGQPVYIYFDLEFSLERDEIVKLLMTDKLYTGRGLFVRELLQNSLDALRHRQALFRSAHLSPPALRVEFEHFQDDTGYDVVRCRDNGVGMDETIVTRFLTRTGRSYYRSPEFERERVLFRSADCDFDPCARFGIGFMSIFMFGDDITIYTRRDYGVGKQHGPPLVVQVTGLSGIVALRPGASVQPIGTTVEIRGRRKAFVVDQWDDPVWLVDVISGYALATEFPISAKCRVPGIVAEESVPTTVSARPHPIEALKIQGKRLFSIDLAKAHPNLRGEIRIGTLVDGNRSVCANNDEARIVRRGDPNSSNNASLHVIVSEGEQVELDRPHDRTQICADGILVAGEPGRDSRRHNLGHYAYHLRFGGASCLIDARGELKPALTPARTPPDQGFRADQTWSLLEAHCGLGYGMLLKEILDSCDPARDPLRFWLAAETYDLRVEWLPLDQAWMRLKLLLRDRSGQLSWRGLSQVGSTRLEFDSKASPGARLSSKFVFDDGSEMIVPTELDVLRRDKHGIVSPWLWQHLIVATSAARISTNGRVVFSPREPTGHNSLAQLRVGSMHSTLRLMYFEPSMPRVMLIAADQILANVNDPVVGRVSKNYGSPIQDLSPLDQFFNHLVWGWPALPSSEPAPEGSWAARTRGRLGKLYQSIDWVDVPIEMQPPYSALIPSVGIEEITREHLALWARFE